MLKLTNPLPQSLPKECLKAANIFLSFVDRGNNGLDGVIPRGVLEQAKGFAIFTVFKAGFVFSARAGSGVVIAKLDDGQWSAPSAIATAGMGVGGQAGAELTDCLVVLNSRSAVKSFMSAGSFTLGGNLSIAVGPLGRNGEARGSVNSSGTMATMYSYSRTRGLFGGVSIEGSVIVERQDANAKAYHSDVTARSLLSGQVDSPDWARGLIKALGACTGMPGGHVWVEDRPAHNSYLFGGLGSPGNRQDPLKKQRPKKGKEIPFPPASWEIESAESYFDQRPPTRSTRNPFLAGDDGPATAQFEPTLGSDWSSPFPAPEMTREANPPPVVGLPLHRSSSLGTAKPGRLTRSLSSITSPFSKTHQRSLTQVPSPLSNPASGGSTPQNSRGSDSFQSRANQPAWMTFGTPEPETIQPVALHREGITRAIALHDFKAVEPGDLSFSMGDTIIITEMSDSTDDWWTGKTGGKEGIFPANFVELA